MQYQANRQSHAAVVCDVLVWICRPTLRRSGPLGSAALVLAVVSAWAGMVRADEVASGDGAHDPFSGAVEVRHFSFEPDSPYGNDIFFDPAPRPHRWTRRKGPGFPRYVDARVVDDRAHHGRHSLFFEVNGGAAIYYSPPVPVDALHSYVFQGYVRTQMLRHDAALISLSFLDHKRQRVQRFLIPRAVSGTHAGWVRVRIGPVSPKPNVRFVVIGCHLVHGEKMDIRGGVWFDDLWLGKLPRLTLLSNFQTHFKQRSAPIRIESRISGLDAGHRYSLSLQIVDEQRTVLAQEQFQLHADSDEPVDPDQPPPEPHSVVWDLPPQDYGYYEVRSTLMRDGVAILEKQTSFAVMDLVDGQNTGEFGWSVTQEVDPRILRELVDIAAQAGINWLKYPLWRAGVEDDAETVTAINDLFERLSNRGIRPVGLLGDPPHELRSKFARDWAGISEIFTMPPSFWTPSIDPVMARFSANVRHWQLGDEGDVSFVGLQRLPQTLQRVKAEFDRIGRDTIVGVHWSWSSPLPSAAGMPPGFLSIGGEDDLSAAELEQRLRSTGNGTLPRWVVLRPLKKSASGRTSAETSDADQRRAIDLVQRMIAAKIGGADVIFAWNVFDESYGILNANGSPARLFLPWRTTALALQGSEHIGSLKLPGGSTNHAFARDGEATLIIWNDEPSVEELYLGERVWSTDISGRQIPVPRSPQTGRQTLKIGRSPLIVRGCSEPVVRWRQQVRFRNGRVRSETGEHKESVLGVNTFAQGVNVRADLRILAGAAHNAGDWKVEPDHWEYDVAAGQPFELPMFITLPPNASLGTVTVELSFEIDADRLYRFRVLRPYTIGLGDVVIQVIDRKTENGRLEIEQIIINNTNPPEILNFRCSLFAPGYRRMKQVVTKLGPQPSHKFYYLPDAEALRGKELWLRAEQVDGRRVLNYRWTVGRNWDTAAESAPRPLPTP